MTNLVTRVLEGAKHNQPVLLEGEAAAGKTAAVAFAAQRTNAPLLRFNMTPHTSVADFVGQLGLGSSSFEFLLGPFAEAVKDGMWILLDEANLAQALMRSEPCTGPHEDEANLAQALMKTKRTLHRRS